MSLASDINTFLKAYGALTAIVAQRIFPDEFPQGTTLPAVTYSIIDEVYEQPIGGVSVAGTLARVQFDGWSMNTVQRHQIGSVLVAACCVFNGSSVRVIDRVLGSMRSDRDPDSKVYRCSLDCQFGYV
jgi:hypothetical protein